jgi:hypothetical protein
LAEMYSAVSSIVGFEQMHGAARGMDPSATPDGTLRMPGHF